MKIGFAQINPTVGDLSGNFEKIVAAYERLANAGADLVLTPELAITGYPPQDLVFKSRFVPQNLEVLDKLQARLRGADILLIDDLQHICGRTATISEFLHTVNAFTDLKRKVVIAADRPPSSLDGLTDDIRSRLQGAIAIALDKPDAATRLAILKARVVTLERTLPRAKLPETVLEQLANELDVSPRELLELCPHLRGSFRVVPILIHGTSENCEGVALCRSFFAKKVASIRFTHPNATRDMDQ